MLNITQLEPNIIQQLGETAWKYISVGKPQIIHGYVLFQIHGRTCSWGINTHPALLMWAEFEFTNFDDLLTAVSCSEYF